MKTLLRNAKVWLDRNNFTDSIGFNFETGKINFVGTDHQANNIKSEFEEVINLNKKLVIPAFTDGHCHFIKGAMVNSQLNLRKAKTKNDFIEGIRKYKNENKSSWIYGGYFSDSNFKEEIIVSKEFLDQICSDVPIIISKFDMHSAYVNSMAIELSGIANKENEFTTIELIKNNDGKLTGELKERAIYFVMDNIPLPSINERTELAMKQLSNFHSFGITAISDITLFEDLEIYKEMINRNNLLLRVDARLPFTEFENIERFKKNFSSFPELIKFNSLKAFYDGSLSGKTALMHDNYKSTSHHGIRTEYVISGEFNRAVFDIDKAGFQMSVHAIGDKAVSDLLDLNEELINQNGSKDRRFRIEHAQHIHKNDFQRFRDLNVIASVQPAHLFSDAKTAKEVLQDYKIEHNYKQLFDLGAKVCFGTDFPVVSENPFETIYYAMTRKAGGFEDGFVTENKISLNNCLESYTINNAYASYDDKKRGSLSVGKYADIAVLENDLFEISEDEIRNAKVNMTYFNGVRVY